MFARVLRRGIPFIVFGTVSYSVLNTLKVKCDASQDSPENNESFFKSWKHNRIGEYENRLRHNPALEAKVMRVIGVEGRLKRDYLDQLENRDSGKSTYGFIARELEIGTPFSQSK